MKVVMFEAESWCASCKQMKPFFIKECEKLNVPYEIIDVESEKDKKLLESFENKIWDWTQWNHIAYSNVNYKTGDVIRDEAKDTFLVYSMVDIVKWIKYNLLLINNPKNIIIYRFPRGRFSLNCPKFYKEI